MRVIGVIGWKNSGKTTLVVALVKLLCERGFRVATIKHAHHNFDIDKPGKDSYLHREAGATDVIVSSGTRWAHMHEVRDENEPELEELLPHLSSGIDIVVVEGFKRDAHDKIEVIPPDFDGDPLALSDKYIVGVASDAAQLPDLKVPVMRRSDPQGVAEFVLRHLGMPPRKDG